MCVSMVDIQSATAEIRRGKKEEGKKEEEETTGQKYNGLSYYIGWPGHNNVKSHESSDCSNKAIAALTKSRFK